MFACQPSESPTNLTYSTSSDSTMYYYNLGWEQIMDNGQYGAAEVSYRKALSFDPEFLVGKSVLARLTLDLEERIRIFEEVEAEKHQINGDERLILDVYLALTEFTNIREQTPEQAKEVLTQVLQLAEKNFREIVRKYPNQIYLKSEYIEVLHSNHGPRVALDSLIALTSAEQKENPFLVGYAASMYAELAEFEQALANARRLDAIISDPSLPKSFAVFADVYFAMDSLELAKQNADRAVELDARNLDASRLKTKIDAAINPS